MLLYLLYLLPLLPLARAQCSLLSVAGCQPDPSEVIKTYIIPGEPTSMCQQLCTDVDQCNLWGYDSGWHCSLLRTSYLATCDTIIAGYEPDYAQCLAQNSGSCDDFVQENCHLEGSVLWQSDSVTHAYECQEYLQVLGPEYGGKVFLYSRNTHTCTILDTGARECSKVSGPRQPSLEECDDTTTTPKITTTPEVTTTALTTTSAPAKGDGMYTLTVVIMIILILYTCVTSLHVFSHLDNRWLVY